MLAFHIHLDDLKKRTGGACTARIYVTIGERAFPEKGWNDFALVLAGWWFKAVTETLLHPGSSAQCSFMDGNFAFEFSDTAKDNWQITFGGDNYVSETAQVSKADVLSAFRAFGFRLRRLGIEISKGEYQTEVGPAIDSFFNVIASDEAAIEGGPF